MNNTIDQIRSELYQYHHALDTHQNASVHAHKFVASVEKILNAPWKQGATILTWEEKFSKLKELAPMITVMMRAPKSWYVSASMEHAIGECCLISDYGDGETPEEAVNRHWELYANGHPLFYNNQWFRWDGFKWDASEDPRAKSNP